MKREANIKDEDICIRFTIYEGEVEWMTGSQPYGEEYRPSELVMFETLEVLVRLGVKVVYNFNNVITDRPLNPCDLARQAYAGLRKVWCENDDIDFQQYYSLLEEWDHRLELMIERHRKEK